MMARRGMTLIEVLLALAMLSSLVIVSTEWTRLAARSAVAHAEEARWTSAAIAALDLIGDDAAAIDAQIRSTNANRRIVVEGNTLSIRARIGSCTAWTEDESPIGAGVAEYRFDPLAGVLALHHEARTADGRRAAHDHVLLADLSGCRFTLDDRVLSVSLRTVRGRTMSRVYLLAEGDAR